MTLAEFLDKRKKRGFTATEIMCVLHEYGYCFRLMDTRLKHNPGYGKNMGWENGEKSHFIESLKSLGIPTHFAYIKFYADIGYEESADEPANHIFGLVAGKTSYSNLYKTDVLFSEKREDGPAREWLYKNREKHLWYLEKILIVWPSEAEEIANGEGGRGRRALSTETDIGGLFGLFQS